MSGSNFHPLAHCNKLKVIIILPFRPINSAEGTDPDGFVEVGCPNLLHIKHLHMSLKVCWVSGRITCRIPRRLTEREESSAGLPLFWTNSGGFLQHSVSSMRVCNLCSLIISFRLSVAYKLPYICGTDIEKLVLGYKILQALQAGYCWLLESSLTHYLKVVIKLPQHLHSYQWGLAVDFRTSCSTPLG